MTAETFDSIPPSIIRVFHIEDDAALANLLADVFVKHPFLKFIGHSGSLGEGIAECFRLKPEMVLLDVNLSDGSALVVRETLEQISKHSKIIFLTSRRDDVFLGSVGAIPVSGVVYKTSSIASDIVEAARSAMEGKIFYSPGFLDDLAVFRRSPYSVSKILSRSELALIPFFATGASNEEIAPHFNLSPSTIQSHRRDVMKKINVHKSIDLMKWARERGF